VADTDDAVVEFRCRRCQEVLSAPKSEAGTKGLCPRCQLRYEVPAEGTLGTGEEYGLVEGDGPPAAELEEFASVTCPTCQTHIQAKEDQIGGEIACPDCETRVTVPAPEPEEPVNEKPPEEPADIYGLRQEPAAAEPIQGASSQPPPKGPQGPASEKSPQKEPAGVRLSEMLASEKPTTDKPPAEEPKLFPIHCSLCDTLMHTTADQAEQKIVCPDCRTATVVEIPKEEARLDSAAFRVGSDEEYGVDMPPPKPTKPAQRDETTGDRAAEEPAGVAGYQPRIDYRTGRPRDEQQPPDEVEPVPKPPQHPLVLGVFDFPYRPEVRWRALALSAAALPMLLLFWKAYRCQIDYEEMGVYTFGNLMGGLLFTGAGILALLAWEVAVAPYFLTIVRGVSEGIDKIESWPKKAYLEWINDSAIVLVAVVIGAAPGAVLGTVLGLVGLPNWCSWLLTALSLWALFPFLLLSILEENSLFGLVSQKVSNRAAASWRWWGLFYAEVLGLPIAGGAVLGAAWLLIEAVGWVAGGSRLGRGPRRDEVADRACLVVSVVHVGGCRAGLRRACVCQASGTIDVALLGGFGRSGRKRRRAAGRPQLKGGVLTLPGYVPRHPRG